MISADIIKELRDKTGLSVMQCKKALEFSAGDFNKAMENLKSQGAAITQEKASRTLGAGVVASYIHATKVVGAMVELDCETDFVAKNEEFLALAHDIAMHVAAMSPETVDELLEQPFVKDQNNTVGDLIKATVQKFGENTSIRRFSRFSVKD